MSQATLFLLAVAFSGLMTGRWTLRLAPIGSEFPLKTAAATVLAGLVGASDWLPFTPSPALLTFTLIAAPLYVFGPLALLYLSRAGAHRAAGALVDALYWTPAGRGALRRLLAQAALQQGDARAAYTLSPEADPLLAVQAAALEEQWERVLSLEPPQTGDNAFLALDARVQAYLALGRLRDAEAEVAEMRTRQERSPGPIGYRSVTLAEARVAAERGQLAVVREKLSAPPPGIPAHVILSLAGRAAEQAHSHPEALHFYREAYAHAPAAQRARYAAKLQAYGEALPHVAQPTRPVGMFSLLAAIVAAYLGQLWLDANFGPYGSSAGAVRASSVAAAFMMNLRGLPEPDATWRYLSYAFVHGNLVHIAFNAWVLFDIGRIYEARRTWGSLLAAFAVGTLMGAYLTVLAGASGPLLLVGASGGILGIAGALLADTWRGRGPQDRAMTRSLLQWMVIIVLFSLAIPNVSLWGHVGGVVGGLLWGFVRQGLPRARAVDLFAGGVSLGLLGYALLQVGRIVVTQML